MVTLQEHLNNPQYPTSETKEKVKEIIIGGNSAWLSPRKLSNTITKEEVNELAGEDLDLSNYPNLETIIIDGDYLKTSLISLNISNCSQLKILACPRNQLTGLDLSQNGKLEELYLYDNNFSEYDLSFLSHLVNLRKLYLENRDKDKIAQGVYNRFQGSLEALRNLNQLENLGISNPGFNSGYECLPASLKTISCHEDQFPQLAKYKKKYKQRNYYYDYQAWRRDNPELIIAHLNKQLIEKQTKANQINELETTIKENEIELAKHLQTINFLQEENQKLKENLFQNLLVNCDQCKKEIGKRELAQFSNQEKNIDFCSEDCCVEWISERNIQKWLDKKYSTQEEKEQVEELYLNEYDLKGELDLSKFILLEKIFISYFLDESKINFKNKQEGIEIIKCVKAQVTFDKEYPVNQFCLGILDKKNKGKNRSEITQINLSNNYLEEFLEINGFLNLEEIDLANNKLTSLILIDCFKVEKINCSQNTLDQLPDFFSSLDHSFLENELNVPDTCSLTHLNISNNNISEDLSVFSHLVNLEWLDIRNNNFTGSLESLKNLTKLRKVNIRNNNIEKDSEYLYLHKKVKLSINMRLLDIREHRSTNQKKTEENCNIIKKLSYNIIYPNNIWPSQENKKFLLLPIKLYSIKNNIVIWTKNTANIKSYAIMSYVWGDLSNQSLLTTWNYSYQKENGELEDKKMGVSPKHNATGTTKWSIKALTKAIAACKLLKIDYLWMDQLCINQFNNEEQSREVTKMKRYYGNAAVTLIAIQCDLGEKDAIDVIIRSEWFDRSWTFQEGILSKRTLFMFDDHLVNGVFIARKWERKEDGTVNYDTAVSDGYYSYCWWETENKCVTPLGRTYYEEHDSDIIEDVSLTEALHVTKIRRRTVPLDGIYSILGLLPYGDQIKPKYKKYGEKYSKEELEHALFEVMKVAVANGYGEPLSWFGKGSKTPGLCWVPQIDKTGSANINFSISVNYKKKNLDFIKEDGIEITGSEFLITSAEEYYYSVDGNHGTGQKKITIKIENDYKEIKIWGMSDGLLRTKVGYVIIIPNDEWESGGGYWGWFAILASLGKNNVRHRIDLLGIGSKEEILKQMPKKKLIIGMNNFNKNEKFQQGLQAQIQAPPEILNYND